MPNLHNPFKSHKDGKDKDFHEEYDVQDEIGRGGFAVVYRAHQKGQELGCDVAVRICPLKLALSSHAPYVMTVETLRTKMESAKKMSNDPSGSCSRFCLKMLDYRITKKDLITMTELCTGGDLFDRICNNTSPEGYFQEEDARGAARNLIQVIKDIHARGVIHRDIKPENILYTRPDSAIAEIRLTDFGCCLPYCKAEEWYEGNPVGSPGYTAPELLAGQKYNMLVDEWSAGITIYEMLTGRSPLISQTPEELAKETLERAIPYPKRYWSRHSSLAKDFVQRLLEKDPKRRMSAEEAIQHSWLTEDSGKILAHRENSTASTESDGPDPTEALVGRKTGRTNATNALMAHVTSFGATGALEGSDSYDARSILEGRLSASDTQRLEAMDSGYASATSSEMATEE